MSGAVATSYAVGDVYHLRRLVPFPQAATHHLLDTWRMFQSIHSALGRSCVSSGSGLGIARPDVYQSLCLAALIGAIPSQRAWSNASCSFSRLGSRWAMEVSPFRVRARHQPSCHPTASRLPTDFWPIKYSVSAASPLTPALLRAQEEGVRDYPYIGFKRIARSPSSSRFSWKTGSWDC